jgi:hypothetical protein
MKDLKEYIVEQSLNRPLIRFDKLSKVSKFLNKDLLKKDEKEYGMNYDLPLPQKNPDSKFDLLFRILCGRLTVEMEYSEMIAVVSEYFTDIDMGYELPEEGSYAYRSAKEIWDKDIDPRMFIVHFGNPANRILFQISFPKK